MRDIPRYFREQIDEMRRGLKRGFTPPRVTMTGRDASITAVTDASPEASLFYTPFKDMPGMSDADKAALREQAVAVIRDTVQPAYRDLLTFMRNEYVPGTRTSSRGLRPAGRQDLLPGEDSRIHHARRGPRGDPCARRIGGEAPARATCSRS